MTMNTDLTKDRAPIVIVDAAKGRDAGARRARRGLRPDFGFRPTLDALPRRIVPSIMIPPPGSY